MSASLLGLFGVSFLAATLLPAQSELGLSGLIALGTEPVVLLVAAASLGNTLGSMVNWILGRAATAWSTASWFPVKPDKLAKATGWYHRYGRWSLLLSWAPFGDAFTVIAGMLRLRLAVFVLLVTVAKAGRYAVLAWGTAAVMAA